MAGVQHMTFLQMNNFSNSKFLLGISAIVIARGRRQNTWGPYATVEDRYLGA